MTFASLPQNAEDQLIQLSRVDFRLPANISTGENTTRPHPSNAMRIQCDGEKYGFNPNVSDCEEAKSFHAGSPQLFTYGERHSGHGVDVVPLPYRLMGGTVLELLLLHPLSLSRNDLAKTYTTESGQCYLEPVLFDRSLGTGVASIDHLNNAAFELILQCAARQSQGGIATRIGTSQYARDLVEQRAPELRASSESKFTLLRRTKYGTRPRYLSAKRAMLGTLQHVGFLQKYRW